MHPNGVLAATGQVTSHDKEKGKVRLQCVDSFILPSFVFSFATMLFFYLPWLAITPFLAKIWLLA